MKTRRRKRLTRRDFLVHSAMSVASLILSRCGHSSVKGAGTTAQDFTPTADAYLPIVSRDITPTATPTSTPPPTSTLPPGVPRVVHVRDPDATNWSGSGWYGSAVDQSVVNSMVQAGLQALTSETSWADIWGQLFSRVQASGYEVGQKIAIKVNLNNSGRSGEGCYNTSNLIDALPQPVIALLAGLTATGVAEDDVWIYDATNLYSGRFIPYRLYDPIYASFPGVHFYGNDDCEWTVGCSHGGYSDLTVDFADSRLGDRQLTTLLHEITYLINMPILKRHGISPVTLGFKNHFGSLHRIMGSGSDDLHKFIDPDEGEYSQHYSPLVDIYANPNIKDKTVLIAGDGLYGSIGAASPASQSWSSFGGDAPNSFFFSTDPVAIDCVMADFVESEFGNMTGTHDYLYCAEEAGLGVCEGTRASPGGDPWQTPYGSGYSKIQYVRTDL